MILSSSISAARFSRSRPIVTTASFRPVAGPHGEVRDLLRREGFADLVGGVARITTLESILTEVASEGGMKANVNAPGVSWYGRQSVRRPRPPAPASSSPTP